MSYSVDGAIQFWNNWRLEGNLPEQQWKSPRQNEPAYYSIALLVKDRSLHEAVEQKTWT